MINNEKESLTLHETNIQFRFQNVSADILALANTICKNPIQQNISPGDTYVLDLTIPFVIQEGRVDAIFRLFNACSEYSTPDLYVRALINRLLILSKPPFLPPKRFSFGRWFKNLFKRRR